jgi:cytochrome c oxidase assembly factor CtaG
VIGLTAWGALDVTQLSPVATLARTHNPLHVLMNLLFIGTSLLYWAPILSPANEVAKRISPLFGMLYMFISTQPMMALGAILTFSSQPLFHIYDNAPLIWGFTRLGDQQLAGLTMWLLMDIPLIIVLSVLFFRWVSALDRAERRAADEYLENEGATGDMSFPEEKAAVAYQAEQELIWEK